MSEDRPLQSRTTVRPADYPLTALLINPINRRLVRLFAATPISPNGVTVLSFLLMLAAAAALWVHCSQANPAAGAAAIALVFLSHIGDTLDGDLARYTGRTTELGRSLDPMLDRAGEVACIAAAAAGLSAGSPEVWPLALFAASGLLIYYYATDAWVGPTAMRLRGTRHSVSFGRGATPEDAAERTRPRIKLGLFEPFLYGFPIAIVAGADWYAFAAAGGLFWLGWMWQVAKLVRITRP